MRTRTKTTVSVAAAIALSASLAACSSSDENSELTVWIMGDTGPQFEQLVKPFTEETGIKVNVEGIPWANVNDKITTATATGDGPDVLQIGLSLLPTLAEAENLLPLDDLLTDHPDLAASNFADAVAGEATQIGGQTLSVPWVADTRVLFYRADLLAEVGYNEPPSTWVELHDAATKLADRGADQYGYYIPQWDSSLPVALTWSAGGEVVDGDGNVNFDNEGFREAADFYISMYEDGLVPTNADFDQVQGFVSGIAPMLISGPYLAGAIAEVAPELDGEWAAAPLPGPDGSVSMFAGSNIGIWHNSDAVDESLELLEFLSKPEVQLEWYERVNELPTNKAALADSKLAADPNVEVYVKTLETARVLPMVPSWDQAVGDELTKALNQIVLNGADKEATLNQFFDAVSNLRVL